MVTAIDLFCGAGGFSLGFERAGVDVVAGIDNNEDALETYDENLQATGINADLSQVYPADLLEANEIEPDGVDVVIGGPPCQSFSVAGSRDSNDERGKLARRYYDWIDYLEPDVFLMENVKGILSMENGNVIKSLIDRATSLGYRVDYKIINCAQYGVPQKRERVFIQGVRTGSPSWPTPTHGDSDERIDYVTSADVLGDVAFDDGGRPLKQSSNANETYQVHGKRPFRFTDEPAYTVVGDVPSLFPHEFEGYAGATREEHQLRRLTVDEVAGLQSFPVSFDFEGSTVTSKRQQVGNAVPPKMSVSLAGHIVKVLT